MTLFCLSIAAKQTSELPQDLVASYNHHLVVSTSSVGWLRSPGWLSLGGSRVVPSDVNWGLRRRQTWWAGHLRWFPHMPGSWCELRVRNSAGALEWSTVYGPAMGLLRSMAAVLPERASQERVKTPRAKSEAPILWPEKPQDNTLAACCWAPDWKGEELDLHSDAGNSRHTRGRRAWPSLAAMVTTLKADSGDTHRGHTSLSVLWDIIHLLEGI